MDDLEKYKKILIVGSSLGIVGLILILFSGSFGTAIADSWLRGLGGADTWKYELVMKSNINKFLVIGSILFSVSLISILFSWYRMLFINNE